MNSLCVSDRRKQTDCAQDEQYSAYYEMLAIRFHVSLLLSWKKTLLRKPEEPSVVGIDYEVRMEQTAQLGLRANCWVRLPLPRFFVEDRMSVPDAPALVQLKKSMGTMRPESVLW